MSNLNILFPLLGSGKSDPIEGLTSFRLQTHHGKIDHYKDAVQVSGAGEIAVNGLYVDNGSIIANQPVYIKGPYAIYFDGNGHILTLDTVTYYRNDSEDATATWRTSASEGPPTVTTAQAPFYKPSNLYKDTDCTIPALVASDVVLGVQDDISKLGIQAIQSDSTKGPIIGFDNGVPYLDFDGINDWLLKTGADIGGQVTYSALFRSKTPAWNNFWSLFNTPIASDSGIDWLSFFNYPNTNFYDGVMPTSVSKNGVALSSPFDLAPINDWLVTTITTNSGVGVTARGIGLLKQQYFGSFQLIALILHDPTDSAVVQSYLHTLKP